MGDRDVIIKTPKQIEGIRNACRLVARTLDMIGEYVRIGVSTQELDHICHTFIRSHGGTSACIDYLGNNRWWADGYPKCTCISRNDIICHGIPRADEYLEDGDILNIDLTVIVDGYFGDSSRMYQVGTVSHERKKLVEDTREAMMIGIAEIAPGKRMGDIGYAISHYAEERGYSVVREYTGHGVGVRFHESPYVYHRAKKGSGIKMVPGMIFTVEPMINLGTHHTKTMQDNWTVRTEDGRASAQWEHTVLVTKKGYEILTVSGA